MDFDIVALILVKDTNLLRSFRIVTHMFFVRCNKSIWTADMWPDNATEELCGHHIRTFLLLCENILASSPGG